MKKYLLLFVSFFFLFPLGVGAVDLKLTYDHDFEKLPYTGLSVLPSYDDNGNIDGYLFCYESSSNDATSGIFKLDLSNKLVYDKSRDEVYVSDIAVKRVDTGNELRDLLITRYGDNDEVLFETKYGGSGDEIVEALINTFDDKGKHDGYLLLLVSTSSDLKIDPGYILLKISLKGDIVWEKNITEFVHGDGFAYVVNKKFDSVFGFNKKKIYRKKIYEDGYA